jgi:hypothetical protein
LEDTHESPLILPLIATNSMRSLFFICFFLIALNSFSQPPSYCYTNRFTDVASFDSSDIRIDSNIVYGIAKDFFTGVSDTLMMDVFYPDTITDTMSIRPFVLLIHGGAFIAGDRSEMYYQCMEFARRGFVTATINYRLGWNCTGTDFLSICLLCGNLYPNIKVATYEAAQDGRAAMRYIDAHSSNYKIDSDNYFIGGASAGSITALHVAYWDQQEADAFCASCTGQTGLLDTSGNSLPNNYQFKGIIDNCGGISKDSAMLNNGNISMISFHDEGDCVVPNQFGQVISCACQVFYFVSGSSTMHNFLSANGICTSMNLVPLSINHCSYPQYELVNRASCFIRSVMCDSCQSAFNNTPYTPQGCSMVGVHEYNSLKTIQVVPNPASEYFQLSGLENGTNYSISVLDLSGRKILEKIIAGSNHESISTSEINSGIYFVRVVNKSNEVFLKLMVSNLSRHKF